jgi:CheY-like chemotaxis protein
MHILLVEDDTAAWPPIERALRKAGHVVYMAATGHLAIHALCHEPIDLILLDMNLGDGLSGYDVARFRNSTPKLRAIPIIVTSGSPSAEVREEARKNALEGVSLYLEKPLDLTMLLRHVSAIASAQGAT